MTTAVYRSASVFALALAALAACSRVPDSFPRNQALYLELRDGVRIAIDVWLPESLSAGEKVPTVMQREPEAYR
jgi:predicted acyl esterase